MQHQRVQSNQYVGASSLQVEELHPDPASQINPGRSDEQDDKKTDMDQIEKVPSDGEGFDFTTPYSMSF